MGRALGVLDHVGGRGDDLGDHVPGAHHDHLLALAQVLAHEVLLVVQGGELDRDAPDGDRGEHRVGAQVAELAHVPHHPLERGHGGGGRELPGDRPARLAPDGPQAPVQGEVVDLHHRPVDLEVELPAAALPFAALGDHLLLGGERADAGVDAEAVLGEPLQRL